MKLATQPLLTSTITTAVRFRCASFSSQRNLRLLIDHRPFSGQEMFSLSSWSTGKALKTMTSQGRAAWFSTAEVCHPWAGVLLDAARNLANSSRYSNLRPSRDYLVQFPPAQGPFQAPRHHVSRPGCRRPVFLHPLAPICLPVIHVHP